MTMSLTDPISAVNFPDYDKPTKQEERMSNVITNTKTKHTS
jgi:hypothetical protein